MACDQAYASLQSTTPTEFGDAASIFCTREGYDVNDVNEFTACQDAFLTTLQTLTGYNGTDITSPTIQMYIAQRIQDFTLQNDPVGLAEFVGRREMASKMAGMGVMANDFVPIFRNIMMALAFAISPLIFMFLATFAIQAFKYYIGLFAFLAVWGVMDAILYNFFLTYAMEVFKTIQGLSLNTIFSLDVTGAETLSVLGYFRLLGGMISASIVFGIMKFGGDAFASAMGAIQSQMSSAGAAAGRAAGTAEGRAAYMKELEKGIGNLGAYRATSVADRTAMHEMNAKRSISTATTAMKLTGLNAGQTGETLGRGAALAEVANTAQWQHLVDEAQ